MRSGPLARATSAAAVLLVAAAAHAKPLTDYAVDVPPVEGGTDEAAPRPAGTTTTRKPEGAAASSDSPTASTQKDGLPAQDDVVELDKVVVDNPEDDYFNLGGSAHVLDEEDLEEFEHDDVHSVLLSVPGVYVRGEDGYGLRPNIGLRGANSDRSKKVTLMEDGVLFGPAPYSAPAAYYFPVVTRMTEVEVIKGPASVIYGPNTIGGAVNLHTRRIPDGLGGGVDVAGGSYFYGKGHGHVGYGAEHWGVLGEAVHLRTDGFKELDGGGDTGFVKNEFMIKGRLNTDRAGATYNELEVKLGYATEVSNETYLGLTEADFADNPLRRYRASERDRMEWERTQVEVQHKLDVGNVHLTTTVYRHDLHRIWRKLNSLADAAGRPIEIFDVLRNPNTGRNSLYYDVLVGNEVTEQDVTLRVGANERTFVSQGIQTVGEFESLGVLSHDVQYGARYHYDEIVREHTDAGFFMRDLGDRVGLQSDGSAEVLTTHNKGSTHAVALHAIDEMTWKRLTVAPGMRVELINNRLEDRPLGAGDPVGPVRASSQRAFLPGLGLFYAFTDDFGALLGAHRGFSPVSPGQVAEVEPETSINYEGGARFAMDLTQAEVIGFFNDYDNLTPECAFSQGCAEQDLDRQFAGGAVDVFGVETLLATELRVAPELGVPLRVSYTLTQTVARTGFTSSNPQLADVQAGDELPYVPAHQASLQAGLKGTIWGAHTSATYVSPMREQAGRGPLTGDETETDASFIVDLAGQVEVFERATVYGKIDNVIGSSFVASRRPFGARPVRPRLFQLGFKYAF